MTGPARHPGGPRQPVYAGQSRRATGLPTANSLSDGAGLRERAPTRHYGRLAGVTALPAVPRRSGRSALPAMPMSVRFMGWQLQDNTAVTEGSLAGAVSTCRRSGAAVHAYLDSEFGRRPGRDGSTPGHLAVQACVLVAGGTGARSAQGRPGAVPIWQWRVHVPARLSRRDDVAPWSDRRRRSDGEPGGRRNSEPQPGTGQPCQDASHTADGVDAVHGNLLVIVAGVQRSAREVAGWLRSG